MPHITNRQRAYLVAFISTIVGCLSLLSTSLAISHKIPTDMDHDHLLASLYFAVILIASTLLLFFGIYFDSKCLILPWLIIDYILQIDCGSIIIGYIVAIIKAQHNYNLIHFFVEMLNFLILIYPFWVILVFLIDLFKYSSNNSSDRRSGS